ncbi:hypothetical protein [Citrobacter freundii]|uniref:hypothetical protein n=1 Tax=Citrobacter freundii TaxID=546 RepID=UPI0023B11754|nr:hypothetical protein [Citrobacter freundii]
MKKSLVLGLLLLPCYSFADECQSVIALSKVVNTTVQDRDEVETNAANFCNEYSKGSSSGNSSSYGASFKFLSASFGSSNVTAEQVASKYCSASDIRKSNKDVYKNYIETISPEAYSAYQQCLEMKNQEVIFDINTASILPDAFAMSVGFASGVSASSSATLLYSASDGISCKWDDNTDRKIQISTGSTAVLDCRRSDHNKRGFIKVLRTDKSNKSLTIPWQAYDDKGNPIDLMLSLQQRIDTLNGQVISLNEESQSTSSKVDKIENESVVEVYQCPNGSDGWGPGGAWGFYGCQGQITTESTCLNIEYPHKQTRQCLKLGKMRFRA